MALRKEKKTEKKNTEKRSYSSRSGDTKPYGERGRNSGRPSGQSQYGENSSSSTKRSYSSRSGDTKPYGERGRNSGRPSGQSRYGENSSSPTKRSYSSRSGDTKPYGERGRNSGRPSGQSRYGENSSSPTKRSYSSRSGDTKPYGERGRNSGRPSGQSRYGENSSSPTKRSYSSRSGDTKPYGERGRNSGRPSGQSRYGENSSSPTKRSYSSRSGDTKPYGERGRNSGRPSGQSRYGENSSSPTKRSYSSRSGDTKPYGERGRNSGRPSGQSRYPQKKVVADTRENQLIRLNKYIANSGMCSRRQADEMIRRSLISVNHKVITEMGYKVKPQDKVHYEDKLLRAEKPIYVLLNKPKGFITTTDDPQERKTVMGLVAQAGKERLYPVGRLDRSTTGLLLLTNDGELTNQLTHPSYKIKKVYKAVLNRELTKNDFQKIQKGVWLEEGQALVDDIVLLTPEKTTVGIELHIGWNRIIHRIFGALGYEVVKLDRTFYAGLSKKDLSRGDWRHLTPKEIIYLKHF